MIRLTKGRLASAIFLLTFAQMPAASAAPSLVVDVSSGEVLQQEDAARPWYPASLTKLMAVYVALKAVRDGRVTFDTPFVVSPRAARMPPSKMGFRPGAEVTLSNLLQMLMVKSANDLAVTLAEGVSGSVEDFADEMNAQAARLGMRDSHFVNPNGLHDPAHYSSARDMALVSLALLREFPEEAGLYGIGALRLDNHIIPTHNGMLGRYPGADGMKTGYTCASGFNVVSTATHGGRKLMVVILGAPSAKSRTLKAMALLDEGFNSSPWGHPQLASLPYLGAIPAPNMRDTICGRGRSKTAEQDFVIPIATQRPAAQEENAASFFASNGRPSQLEMGPAALMQLGPRPAFTPVDVFVGRRPGWNGPVAQARDMPAVASLPKEPAATQTAARKPIGARAPVAASAATTGPLRLTGAAAKPKTPPEKQAAPAKPAVKEAVAKAKTPEKTPEKAVPKAKKAAKPADEKKAQAAPTAPATQRVASKPKA
jgi:D-alanyl-D-alanine carboxypeptidase